MSALDTLADKAQAASRRLAGQGGLKGKLAEELADDAEFLRKLKPELIKRRAKGDFAADGRPLAVRPPAPEPTLDGRPAPKRDGGGPNPFLVVGAALVLGVAVAKWIDWRGHGHPRW